uniref:Uncharacterized protein n=1 Tax=Spongospora subterranea TaxID=70186 RepID=A0A0H5QYQ1_9EUKA|eukprot:CRZ00704.1 hypothetical protein [Spongospora subterranea]
MPRLSFGSPIEQANTPNSFETSKSVTRRTSEALTAKRKSRANWLTRWFSGKIQLDPPETPLPIPRILQVRKKSLPDRTDPVLQRLPNTGCLKTPDGGPKRATTAHVQFDLVPHIILVDRDDLCFSRADEDSENVDYEPARFDLSGFASSDNVDDPNFQEENRLHNNTNITFLGK